jgi:hypothetical protein
MTSIQGVFGEKTADDRLYLEWETLGLDEIVAISIQIATDSEFTQETRTFVMDKTVKSCTLDVGFGKWFYRVGAWIGTEKDGIIEWSGIYGPVSIRSTKPHVNLFAFPTFLTNVKPAHNSIVFYTGLYEPYYMILHATQKDHFKASGLKSYYKYDLGNGSIQLLNMDPQYTYSFQLQMFAKKIAELPKDGNIQVLTDMYVVKNKRSAMPVRAMNNTDRAVYAADKAILQDSIGKPNRKFGSYAEYLQFQAAKARTSASQ